jgi:hypothetical protein
MHLNGTGGIAKPPQDNNHRQADGEEIPPQDNNHRQADGILGKTKASQTMVVGQAKTVGQTSTAPASPSNACRNELSSPT